MRFNGRQNLFQLDLVSRMIDVICKPKACLSVITHHRLEIFALNNLPKCHNAYNYSIIICHFPHPMPLRVSRFYRSPCELMLVSVRVLCPVSVRPICRPAYALCPLSLKIRPIRVNSRSHFNAKTATLRREYLRPHGRIRPGAELIHAAP